MSSEVYTAAVIAAIAVVTWLARGLPYLLFGGKKQIPPIISYLGTVLPPAIMIILVIYCLRNIQFTAHHYGLTELISVGVIAALHLWKRNTILSISAGTFCYMLLMRLL